MLIVLIWQIQEPKEIWLWDELACLLFLDTGLWLIGIGALFTAATKDALWQLSGQSALSASHNAFNKYIYQFNFYADQISTTKIYSQEKRVNCNSFNLPKAYFSRSWTQGFR